MTARDLKPEQRAVLLVPLRREIDYLERLIERMRGSGWDEGCPFFKNASEAYGALVAMRHELRVCEAETLGNLWQVLKGIGSLRR